ncbi:MAG TPA: efflux RND transporter periplasmic adaptor subunit [Roseiarcus sp.]|jgi:membrane fusion protein (multidrug efflux system)|nr:efflux RND transporter periplasmic adaptor subunit [Roseiarcus sp.]
MNWILLALIALAVVAGAGETSGLIKLPVPPALFFAVAGVLAIVFFLRLLPLRARRVAIFALTFVALAGLSGGLYYFQFFIKPQMVKGFIAAAFTPKPTAVTAEKVVKETWAPELPAIGTLHAFQGIDVSSQIAGVIKAVHFKSGENVAAGAPLVDIDASVDEADLKSGMAMLKNAEIALERQQQLILGGNTAKAQVDSALATRDSAGGTVERVKAIIAQKTIVAPFAGRLGISKVDVGQYVAVGFGMVTLQQLDPMYVDFTTPEQSLRNLAVGQEAHMTVDALPGQTFTGKIAAIDARVSQETRNLIVRAEFANPDHKLLPGMFAQVDVASGEPTDVLTLPRTAIVYSLYGDNVFVVKPAPPKEGEAQAAGADQNSLIVERRFVRVGATRGERVSILEGLEAGDLVVSSGQIKLQPNFPVTIDNPGGLPARAELPKP